MTSLNWNSKLLQRLPDPTRSFSLLCLLIMSIRHAFATKDPISTILGLYLNPYALFFLSIATATVYLSPSSEGQKKTPSLPLYDQWAVEWYWWNAWLFHGTMDGVAGSLRAVPVVVHQYDMLDLRFPTHDVVPWIVGLIELFVMQPLCLGCLYCIRTRHTLRFPLEIVTATLQIMGMVIFVGAELFQGQMHIPALDPVGVEGDRWSNVRFNTYHLTYYWFGFWFCNLIWGWVPIIRITRAVKECCKALSQKATKDASE